MYGHSVRSMGCLAAFAWAAIAPTYVQGQWVQWTVGVGGNDHYYQAVSTPGGITWEAALSAATASGAYLATITSANENVFVHGLVTDPTFWFNDLANNTQGPFLGGFRLPGSPNPTSGWIWANGEGPFTYTNWAANEPNNFNGSEDRLQYFGNGPNNLADTWNDIPPAPYSLVRGYVMETAVIPEPTSVLAGCALAMLAGAAIRKRTARKRMSTIATA